jgi:hypothetical protein
VRRIGPIRRPVEQHDRDVRGIRRADHRDHGLAILWHDDDAVHATVDERAHLLELLVGITIGHGFEHPDAARLRLGAELVPGCDPELRLQRLERHANRQRCRA